MHGERIKITTRKLNTKDLTTKNLQRVAIPEAAYVQLRLRPPEDEQDDARNI